MGGQQPVSGATIQLYAIGTSSDYSAGSTLLPTGTGTAIKSDSNGNFSITGKYICGSSTDVYITATGGSPGGYSANANLTLMAALGPCSSLGSSTNIVINEVTTVAAVVALHLFMTGPANVGSSAYDATILQQDFTLAAELVNTANGTSPGAGVPSGMSVPSTLINTLGNVLAACINSNGGYAGDSGSNCGNLFTLTMPPGTGVTAPTDTVTALVNVFNHPTLNTTALFGLINSSAAFQPSMSSAPSTFAVALAQTNPPTITRSFLVEPDDGLNALYALVNNAQSTIDLTVYGLKDTTFSGDLVSACQRGVVVRVVLDQNDEKSVDMAAYTQLNAQANCSAVWANTKYPATHEKSFVVDNTTLAMLTLNIETADYPGTRDFAVINNDPQDVAAFEATFNADYNMTYPYATTTGTDLIWSPTNAQTSLIGIINNATQSLLAENEEMSASNIVTAFEKACQRGVTVNITMTNQTEYHANFAALEAAGCGVHVYPNSVNDIYIHAKTILADYGTSAQYAYVGSINFSTASMVSNRELGIYVYDPATLQRLDTTLASDYAGAPPY
jgi:cardiolipin synthase